MVRFEVRPTADDGFRWRLLSRNNRTIAISPTERPSRRECITHLQQMWQAPKEREPQIERDEQGGWSWILYDGERNPVAQSAAPYPRRIDCLTAVKRFRDVTVAFDDVPVDDVVAEPRRHRRT